MLLQIHPLIELAIWVAFALGGTICVMNFNLPVRYYYRRWKKLPEEHHVSPIPILGSPASLHASLCRASYRPAICC